MDGRVLMYGLPEQNPQVLQQNLESHEDEDGAACQLCLGFIAASKGVACLYACQGQKEGDAADKGHGREDINIQEGKGYADSQGINAGGNGQKHHVFHIQVRIRTFLLLAEGFLYHVGADYSQQDEGLSLIHI